MNSTNLRPRPMRTSSAVQRFRHLPGVAAVAFVTFVCTTAPASAIDVDPTPIAGIPTCVGVKDTSGIHDATGAGPTRTFADNFTPPQPDNWCNIHYGTDTLTADADGLTFHNVPDSGTGAQWRYAEIVGMPAFTAGQSMNYSIKGTDVGNLNGSMAFGLFNRIGDPTQVSLAMFIYQHSSRFSPISDPLRPLLDPTTLAAPDGFFLIVRKAGTAQLQLTRLDERLLAQDHRYTVRQSDRSVEFLIDGESHGVFDYPQNPADAAYPGMASMWLDDQYWPEDIVLGTNDKSEPNTAETTVTLRCFTQTDYAAGATSGTNCPAA
ncbi:hypothetical protein ACFWF7_03035 [Nocardia sp. NPDC060256]|uniref:hypothetical protein n=1 Tax=unclassified Nocardia TaxID=2637762 RepID=UPI00365E0AC1